MRYVYDVFIAEHNKPDKRIATSTQLSEAEAAIKSLDTDWVILVYDNLKRIDTQYLRSKDDIEAWCDTIGRSVWQDKETKEQIRQQLVERAAMGWKPFDETETGIHVKDTAVTKDKPIDSNIKTAAAIGKPQLAGVPPVAFFALGGAMQDGVRKYGKFNWRDTEVTASVFYDAMMRHLLAWHSGEDFAEDSGVHHLAHLMACCAILLDGDMHNVFKDDRKAATPPVVPQKTWWMKAKENGTSS